MLSFELLIEESSEMSVIGLQIDFKMSDTMTIEEELKTQKFQDEYHKATLNVMFTASWLKNKVFQILKNYNLSHEQYNVLRILRGQSPNSLCLREISARMIDRNSNTTRIIDKLEAKGLVACAQSAADKRELNIRVTTTGLALLAEIDTDFNTYQPHLSNLTIEEARILNQLLDKMREME
jgi:DNA-binding MarR family transcriptional regulator